MGVNPRLQQFREFIKHELRIQRPAASLGMELRGEERLRLMLDTLVRPVIHIDEQRFPLLTQRIVIHGVTMVLRGDEAFLRAYHTYRLVMATMTVLQFIDRSTAGFRQQLVTHANTANRLIPGKRLTDIPHGGIASIRIARTVADKQAIVFQLIEVVVPRHTGSAPRYASTGNG